MTITLPDIIFGQLKMTEAEIRLELAVALYRTGKLSFGKARELAGLDWFSFRHVLAENQVPVHYDLEAFEQDLRTVESMP